MNVVTTISSKLSAKASRAPASRAERSCGKVTSRNVWKRVGAEVGGRLLERLVPIRRSRASTLLKTTTMQNVACPMITVQQPERRRRRTVRNAEFSAMPVTMPGSAIGRTTRKLIGVAAEEAVALPRRRRPSCRARARRRRAEPDLHDWCAAASRAPALSRAGRHQSRVKPVGGQPKCVRC